MPTGRKTSTQSQTLSALYQLCQLCIIEGHEHVGQCQGPVDAWGKELCEEGP